MIKKIINLDFHILIENQNLLDNSKYLHGIKYEKALESSYGYTYVQNNYILCFNSDLNNYSEKMISNDVWLKVVYYSADCLIFQTENYSGKVFISFNGTQTNKITCDRNMKYVFEDDKLLIYNKRKTNVLTYNTNLEEIEFHEYNISNAEKIQDGFYLQDNMEEMFPGCLTYKVKGDGAIKYYYLYYGMNNQKILTYDNDSVISSYEVSNIDGFYYNDFYYLKENYFILYNNENSTKFIIRKYDNNQKLIHEEIIRAYRCDIVVLSNNLCLIVDYAKNYSSELKKLRKQELLGNSSIILLDKIESVSLTTLD